MAIQRLPAGVAISVVLLIGACGDDSKGGGFTQDASSVVAAPEDASTKPPDDKDGGIDGGGVNGLDSSVPDSATGPAPTVDASVPAPATDSSVPAPATDSSVPAPEGDGSVPAPEGDGSVPAPEGDGSVPAPEGDGSVPAPEGDGGVEDADAALVVDGGVTLEDSGSSSPDAGASADAGPCPINHPTYGCGSPVGESWVVFDTGLEIDRVNHRAWTPVVDVLDDDALNEICTPLALGGLTGYDLPQMVDVRTLAAGCAETVPGGSCQVDENMVSIEEAGDCTCQGGVGPNNGKFCRPEVPTCETLWSWTHTYETGWYQHWFYDVTTGSILTEQVGVGIAVPAKGRCVRTLTDAELP